MLPDPSLDRIFRSARTYNGFGDKPVTDETLRRIYDLLVGPHFSRSYIRRSVSSVTGLSPKPLYVRALRKIRSSEASGSMRTPRCERQWEKRQQDGAADLFGYTQLICHILTINWTYRLAL